MADEHALRRLAETMTRGLPALCAPMGPGENGLPTSIQWMGGPNSEELLLAIGNEFQARTTWHTATPGGA